MQGGWGLSNERFQGMHASQRELEDQIHRRLRTADGRAMHLDWDVSFSIKRWRRLPRGPPVGGTPSNTETEVLLVIKARQHLIAQYVVVGSIFRSFDSRKKTWSCPLGWQHRMRE